MRTLVGYVMMSAAILAGCGAAPDTVQGGQPITIDAGSSMQALGGGDDGGGEGGTGVPAFMTGLSADCLAGGMHAGSTWQDLYTCYFGPKGAATCTFTAGGCHGGSSEPGTASSNFACGSDPLACYMSITSSIVPSGSATSPTTTTLYNAIRKAPGFANGTMPLSPSTVVFGSGDLARITDWIGGGALNN